MTECDEDFFYRAVFIGDRYENALFISRRDRRQREHVTLDDVFFDLGDIEITARILGGDRRMVKAVEFLELDRMPVIEEIIVKKSASYELLLLEAEGKDHGQE